MIKRWLTNYIRENKKDIFVISMLILIGVCIGIVAYVFSSSDIKNEFITSARQVFEISKSETYVKTNILLNGIKADIILIAIMLILSITLFGKIGIYLILILKGVSISFYALILTNIFGILWGIPVILMLIVLVNLIYIPALIYVSVSMLEVNFNIFNVKLKQSNMIIVCDLIKGIMLACVLMFSSLVLEQMLSFVVLKIYLRV